MRQEFINIVKKLQSDEFTAVSIVDTDTNTEILNRTLGSYLKSKHGSITQYFENLKNSGVTNLIIQEYRKNGNSFKKVDFPFPVSFTEKANNTVSKNQNPSDIFTGLAGAGLGFADIMAMNANSVGKEKVEAENIVLKGKIEALLDENYNLKERLLEQKYNVENKQGTNQLLIGLAEAFAPIAKGIADSRNTGLNAPVQPQFTEKKQHLFNLLKDSSFSEAFADFILQLIATIQVDSNVYNQILDIIANTQKKSNDKDE